MPKKSSEDNRKKALLELKEAMIQEKEKILDHLKKIQQETTLGLNDLSGDDADRAAIEESQRTNTRVGNRERKLLSKIEYTLAKFGDGDDTGTYGICELSGEDIPIARLQARPVAQYTVEAKEELERQEGAFRDSHDDEDYFVELKD